MKIVKQKKTKNIKRYRASSKDITWNQDPKGYFLIRLSKSGKSIEVGFCTNSHVITKVFTGRKPTELYYRITKMIKNLRPEHYAYLGKELQKAFVCMQKKRKYVQDDEI